MDFKAEPQIVNERPKRKTNKNVFYVLPTEDEILMSTYTLIQCSQYKQFAAQPFLVYISIE